MNPQKINEIAVQAGAYWREGYTEQPNGDLAWREKVKVDIVDMDLNKFAELIVKECADYLDAFNRENRVEEGIGGAEVEKEKLKSMLYTSPPYVATPRQRTWVGLDWNEMPEIYMNDKAFEHGVQWAETKLKEKNTK